MASGDHGGLLYHVIELYICQIWFNALGQLEEFRDVSEDLAKWRGLTAQAASVTRTRSISKAPGLRGAGSVVCRRHARVATNGSCAEHH
jgi:hypothetical protein